MKELFEHPAAKWIFCVVIVLALFIGARGLFGKQAVPGQVIEGKALMLDPVEAAKAQQAQPGG